MRISGQKKNRIPVSFNRVLILVPAEQEAAATAAAAAAAAAAARVPACAISFVVVRLPAESQQRGGGRDGRGRAAANERICIKVGARAGLPRRADGRDAFPRCYVFPRGRSRLW